MEGSSGYDNAGPLTPVGRVEPLKATPNQVLNNGTSTSAITATVDGPSGYVVGDSVSVALVGTPAAACGTILPASIVTNAVGVASFTYTSSTTVGFCTVTATEAQQGAKGTATVDQVTVVPASSFYAITVQASPPSIPANGASISTITATVTGQDTAPVANDEVMFSLVGTDCGTFTAGPSPQYLPTLVSGTAVETYTSSTTYGTCTVDVQEANQAQVNSTVITQTPVGYVVTLAASPSYVVAGGATPNSTLTATVTFGGAPAVGDDVTFTPGVGGPEPATITCGTFTGVAVPTNSAGKASVTYVGSAVSTDVGFCPVTATESATSAAATTYVTQRSSSSTANSLTVAETPSKIPADGATTSNVIATVTGSGGTGITGDEVMFQYSGASCGTPADGGVFFGPTIAGGTSTDVYTASHTAGVCTVTATEANSAATGTGTITQGPVVYSVVVLATPSTLTGNGIAISTITATVTNTFGLPQPGDTVTFAETPYFPVGTCGTLSAGSSAITNASGVATLTYTSSAAAGFCVIAATETVTTGTGSTQIDQTSV